MCGPNSEWRIGPCGWKIARLDALTKLEAAGETVILATIVREFSCHPQSFFELEGETLSFFCRECKVLLYHWSASLELMLGGFPAVLMNSLLSGLLNSLDEASCKIVADWVLLLSISYMELKKLNLHTAALLPYDY